MTKTMSLREDLQGIFKELTSNVYYSQALDSSVYPYLVFDLTEIMHSYGKTTIELEVNIIDYGKEVDELADEIQNKLDNYYGLNIYIQYAIYIGKRNTIQEEDKKIIRRRLTFEVQLHERS